MHQQILFDIIAGVTKTKADSFFFFPHKIPMIGELFQIRISDNQVEKKPGKQNTHADNADENGYQ